MNALRRVLAALVLVGVLVDASACSGTFTPLDSSGGPLSVSAQCPCGCKSHTGLPAGIGLGQLAAPPAEVVVPLGSRVLPVRAPLPSVAPPPVRAIDHVPIVLA